MVKFIQLGCAAALLALCVTTTLGGCATQAVWEKWKAREEISVIGLALRTSDPDEVEVGWRAQVADGSDMKGVLSINPTLVEECKTVEVLVARRAGAPKPVLPHEQMFETSALTTSQPVEAIWSEINDPMCTLLLVFRRSDEHNAIAVSASWQARASVSVESIGAPRQAAWLTLLPASVVADTASVIVILPIAQCLRMGQGCGSAFMGTGNLAE